MSLSTRDALGKKSTREPGEVADPCLSFLMSERIPHLPQGLSRKELDDPQVLAAIARVSRIDFVPSALGKHADEDRALPIGEGQTISQPFMVGWMTQLCAIQKGTKVLEIGTGSGYQAAVLAELGAEVFTLEILPKHHERATSTLLKLGYSKVRTFLGDGWNGLPELAPFDVILLTAASPAFPEHLLKQLSPSGRMVLPREEGEDEEILVVCTLTPDGMKRETKGRVRFVPLTGQARQTPLA